jgi:hypothetical protein
MKPKAREEIKPKSTDKQQQKSAQVRTSEEIERQARLHYRFPLGRLA